MNRKHFWSVIVVLAISAYVLYKDFQMVPVSKILSAGKNLNFVMLFVVLLMMLLPYVCEALILYVLSRRKNEPKRSKWSFLRIPFIQALFNAITPMSSGGQPAQLASMVQMGVEGGRATSLLLMKFIIYQIVVFFAYVFTMITGFHLVAHTVSVMAVLIVIGFVIHVCSIIFLVVALFAASWTKKIVNFLMDLLEKFFSHKRVANWRKQVVDKIDTFYLESQKLKNEPKKLWLSLCLTVLQMFCFYSIPYMVLLSLNIKTNMLMVMQMNILITMLTSVIPIPGATGGAEISFQVMFAKFIPDNASLVLGMFIWRFATYFMGLIVGIFGWIFKPQRIVKVQRHKERN